MMENQTNLIFQDKNILCQDCGREFPFTAGEQQFYYSKGLSEPKRCPACRARRRRTIMPGLPEDQVEML
jgi:DNA-directed RNA polymerase subunit RPC12/RpoP